MISVGNEIPAGIMVSAEIEENTPVVLPGFENVNLRPRSKILHEFEG